MEKKITNAILLFLISVCAPFYVAAQNGTVHVYGVVKKDDGTPLGGATVMSIQTHEAFLCDSNGHFSMDVPVHTSLNFSFIGYLAKDVKVNKGGEIDVELKEDEATKALNDVVVVGYGKQKLPTVTGAIETVSGKDLVATPVANVTTMLVGRVPGLSALQNSGEPGSNAASIHIRGISTINGADPLIVIDGIQQPSEQPYVVLNTMDANEIESVSVLKDASATAVYGIRGANGVIIITTKRGKKGQPKFTFSANQAYTKAASLFQTINSYEFAQLRNQAVLNSDASGDHSYDQLLFSQDQIWKFQHNRDYTPDEVNAMSNLTDAQKTELLKSPALYYTSHDYYQDEFGGTGAQQQYNLNISGGTNSVKYYTSLGYFNQNGILSQANYGGANTNPTYKRYNFRSNFDVDVIRNFQLTFNIAGQSSVAQFPGANQSGSDFADRYQGIIQNILEQSPFAGPGIVNGHLVTSFTGTAGTATNPLGNMGGPGSSPISALLTGGFRQYYTTTLTSSITLKHTMDYITKGLSSHFTLAYDDSYVKAYARTNSVPQYSAMRDPNDPLNIVFIGGQVNPSSTSDNVNNSSWNKIYMEAAINYERSFGGHNVTGLILGNAQRYTASGQSYNTPSGLMGLVGRATYNYRERYLFEFNLGVNGTEQFAPGNRFGYFPAYSGGWVLSNEPFFPKNNILTWVKFRGSYGEVGNDQLGGRRFLYLPNTWAYSGSGYYFGSSNGSSANPYYSGALETALGNPGVTWERSKKTDIAAELKFFKDKLSFSTDLFWEKRDNILVTLGIIPSTYGVPQSNIPPSNVGKVSNHGFEIESSWSDHFGELYYSVKGSVSYAKNKIDYEAEAPYPYPWMDATGYSIGQYKGLIADGFYNTQEELNNKPYNAFGNNAKLGDLKYRDINGDGTIDQEDEVPIGYPNLPEIAYNFSLNFSYKGFDISALFIGTAKGSFPQYGYILSSPFAKNVGEVLQYAYDGVWTQEKYAEGKPIYYPEISLSEGGPNNSVLSTFWLKPNNFIRLKNLELGYTFKLSDTFQKHAYIKAIRLYANGNNLTTWGSHLIKGIDPEQADNGKNNMGYLYPLTKTFNIGANIQF